MKTMSVTVLKVNWPLYERAYALTEMLYSKH